MATQAVRHCHPPQPTASPGSPARSHGRYSPRPKSRLHLHRNRQRGEKGGQRNNAQRENKTENDEEEKQGERGDIGPHLETNGILTARSALRLRGKSIDTSSYLESGVVHHSYSSKKVISASTIERGKEDRRRTGTEGNKGGEQGRRGRANAHLSLLLRGVSERSVDDTSGPRLCRNLQQPEDAGCSAGCLSWGRDGMRVPAAVVMRVRVGEDRMHPPW
ncbi:hypothetical protein K438DRAFT_1810433 [Mycena galopus ATCC 62051]|nr:hypothetical protein K438DRAFT_1810433 [Mycena galopus ATCC 62051]